MNDSSHLTLSPENPAPIAMVGGQAFTSLPKDLYIPPDAMEVFLEAFEGPLDLLLYLIKKQNIDILNIPIAEVTRQYMEYVELMKTISLELAAEYLVMAAILAEIKSRMLLPRPENIEGTEEDPRAELIRRLQEYERFKKAAEEIDQIPRQGRDTFLVNISTNNTVFEKPQPTVSLQELVLALSHVLRRAELGTSHQIQLETMSVRERMTIILSALQHTEFVTFSSLFTPAEGRLGVVVTFLAMLELLKNDAIEFVQSIPFGPIHLKVKAPG
ncbi:MAG: scpA [Gammaproteobacteria bacterium]|jgi:segregation and condensation protein A|nr:scpA [Gammaproteobacteria bacterium]